MSTASNTGANLLLRTLPAEALERAGVHDEDHQISDVLIGAEETPGVVFFPHPRAVVSVVRMTTTGQTVETGLIGEEGMVNVHTLLTGAAFKGTESIVQGEGRFSRIDAA